MITTKKLLLNRLKDFKDNEKLLVLFWSKDEFDQDLESRALTKKEWETMINSVDESVADEYISDQLTQAVGDIAAEEES